MSEFQPGDVVVCVNNAPSINAKPRHAKLCQWLRLGHSYRVRTTGLPRGCIHVDGDGLDRFEGWKPWRFRRIDPASESFTRQVRACRPIKTKVEA